MAVELAKLEEELRNLQKQRGEVEKRLREYEAKERGPRKPRDSKNHFANKRGREDTSRRDESNSKEEPTPKKTRLTSTIASGGGRFDNRDRERGRSDRDADRRSDRDSERRSFRERDSDNSGSNVVKPKLTSAIASGAAVSNRPRPTETVGTKEDVNRHKKMFGLLVGTLQQFKADITKKSDVTAKREELENKISERVKQEEVTMIEEQRRTLQELKEKELVLKQTLDKQLEEKSLELLNLKWQQHRNQLAVFIKTEAKPHIYYRPNNKPEKSKDSKDKSEAEENGKESKDHMDEDK